MINHNLDVASVNVVVDTPEHYYLEDAFDNIEMIGADVHCVGCNMLLGQTIVRYSVQFSSFCIAFCSKLGSTNVNECYILQIAVDSFHERLIEGRLMLEL